MADKVERKRNVLQLSRLETFTDVLYAIVVWNIFSLIPDPAGEWPWATVPEFLHSNRSILFLIVIGVLISIFYWVQSNKLFGNLAHTDWIHTSLSIIQLFFLLIFLYTLHLAVVRGTSTGTMVFQSCAVVLMGAASASAWSYAKRNGRLLMQGVSEKNADDLTDQILAEPASALITVPFAFIGAVYWEISWLSVIPVILILKLLRRSGHAR